MSSNYDGALLIMVTRLELSARRYLEILQTAVYELLQETERFRIPGGTHVLYSLVLRSAVDANIGGFLAKNLFRLMKAPLDQIVRDLEREQQNG